jgi:hypothetical protein
MQRLCRHLPAVQPQTWDNSLFKLIMSRLGLRGEEGFRIKGTEHPEQTSLSHLVSGLQHRALLRSILFCNDFMCMT